MIRDARWARQGSSARSRPASGWASLGLDGGAISGAGYALGFVDLIGQWNHHRAHVNLAY